MPTDLDCDKINNSLKDVHNHIRELREDVADNGQELALHLKEYKADRLEHNKQHIEFMSAITLATTATRELADRLFGVIAAWEALLGAIKVGATFGRFIKFLVIISILGGGITYFFNHISTIAH